MGTSDNRRDLFKATCTPAGGSLAKLVDEELTLEGPSIRVEQDRQPGIVLHRVLSSRSVPQSILGVCDGRKGSV
jgi:hypothetical protein